MAGTIEVNKEQLLNQWDWGLNACTPQGSNNKENKVEGRENKE